MWGRPARAKAHAGSRHWRCPTIQHALPSTHLPQPPFFQPHVSRSEAVLELISDTVLRKPTNMRRRGPGSGTRTEAKAEESEGESGKRRGEQESKTRLCVQQETPTGASSPRVVQGPLMRPQAWPGRTWRTPALAEQTDEPKRTLGQGSKCKGSGPTSLDTGCSPLLGDHPTEGAS